MGLKRRMRTPKSEYTFRVKVMMAVSRGMSWADTSKRFGVPQKTLLAWNRLLAEGDWNSLEPLQPDRDALCASAKRGKTKEILAQLKAGAGIDDTINSDNDTLLHVAVESSQSTLVTRLIAEGANLESLSGVPPVWTPLQCALRNKNTSISSQLIDAGANMDAAKGTSWSPLLLATSAGLFELAILLVQKGASTSVWDVDQGLTPLHYAAKAGNVALVKQLLAVGADTAALADAYTDGVDRTPLDLAKDCGHTAVANILSK